MKPHANERTRLTVGLAAAGLLGAAFGTGVAPSPAQEQPATATTPAAAAPTETTPTTTVPAAPEAPVVVGEDPAPARDDARDEPAVVGEPTASDRERTRERRATAKLEDAATERADEEVETTRRTEEAEARAVEAERLTGEGRTPDGLPTADNPGLSLALPGAAPIGVPNFFIEKFRIPPFLLPIYQAAGIEYGVRWEILAAINEIETDYGRNLNVSSAGALGWMQFIPSSWKAYGVDANRDGKKDPYNPVDAIFAAARYLKAAGAEQDIRKAIFAYNHADWYVESVLMRARLIGGLPADLVGSLTGLTQGRFPVDARARYADDLSEREAQVRMSRRGNAARVVESDAMRRGIDIFARPGSPAIAVQDGTITRIGRTARLGRFVQLRDVYGNTYTYARLGRVAATHLVPAGDRRRAAQGASPAGRGDAAPARSATGAARPRAVPAFRTRGASAGPAVAPSPGRSEIADNLRAARGATAGATAAPAAPERPRTVATTSRKQRLFANPERPAAYPAGGARQLAAAASASPIDTGATAAAAAPASRLAVAKGVRLVRRPLRVGSRVVAGATLGLVGSGTRTSASHLRFEIRPAGRGAPRIDPKPILDGWKLLESTAVYRAAGKNPFFGPDARNPTIGQILLLGKSALQRRVLANRRITVYECGRRDIAAGIIDRRALATLEFLAASGLKPTVTSLRCGHGYYTASGNVSEHTTGTAIDIAKVNGIPILGHQGAGSITDLTIRRLLTLQGTMKPHQIISLMTFEGADNTIALPDHADHIHVGFRPQAGTGGRLGRQFDTVLKPNQWFRLIDRLNRIENPEVAQTPSDAALPAAPGRRSTGHAE